MEIYTDENGYCWEIEKEFKKHIRCKGKGSKQGQKRAISKEGPPPEWRKHELPKELEKGQEIVIDAFYRPRKVEIKRLLRTPIPIMVVEDEQVFEVYQGMLNDGVRLPFNDE